MQTKRTIAATPARTALALAALALAGTAAAQTMDVVTIQGGRPTSLPAQIPTTIEGITARQIEERINAFDSEDALKYFPSLNVRKRFTGDYDHAVLASRASGTGNSARSLVYADGILLSNLLGNGATYTPRWGMVTPEEIERVDVLYGPFSAAYPGNSVGAVVDYQTRMPKKLEGHVRIAGFAQRFEQYATKDNYYGRQGSASLGDRVGAFAWWIDVARLDSNGQPVGFANKLAASGTTAGAATAVTGAVPGRNASDRDWFILGATNQVHTVQDHAKVKLAYDVSPVLRASYTLGWWRNDAERRSASYLRDAAGNPVTSGSVAIGGGRYTLLPSDFAPARGELEHLMHGLSLKRHAKDVFDWELAYSRYDYRKDLARVPTIFAATPDSPGAGNVTDMHGSGWNTAALKGTWRPDSAHVVDMGVQRDAARLRTRVVNSPDWIAGTAGRPVSTFNGETRLESVYLQDTWRIDERWKATLGARLERWRAFGGEMAAAGGGLLPFAARSETSWSPKAALAWRADDAWTLKASAGRAIRNPTAAELFQGSIVDERIVNTDPNLRAERSWTGELTAERMTDAGSLRATLFRETTRDALYSQPLTATVSTVQNVGRIRTTGLELAQQAGDVWLRGLSISSSLTYADSRIVANDAFPASVGKRQPRVPRWRANALASYAMSDRWTGTLGVRYSGRQYGTLDNSDPNGLTYMGVSDYLVADARLRYRFDAHWSGALGIDNLNGEKYWAFHPYTQRTLVAELKFDL
ncbi:TonB-dependent receptor [Pseudoduganella plicata]|uniref:Siderophore receptor protein n=1 Tax=Pseudoduganella plicata TaxID=321984 RepID=A0A4P7BLB6_9BURK|nr:TonB-dependent receptor [Pseudoduganella plicata]QBQ39027.1 TonB-dependent receptor [Pseudoduganella plicata]GGY86623.1 siderophore receptor protein [Pseudoduganella plicata]